MRVADPQTGFKIFRLNKSSQYVEIPPSILKLFTEHQQSTSADEEAGGLLFAEISKSVIRVVSATAPAKSDRRGRFFFRSSRKRAKSEIKRKFQEGLHFVGEWHTHPEPNPSPSQVDMESMSEVFIKSKHQLEYFIMIIVGNDRSDMKLWVSLHNGTKPLRMIEKQDIDESTK